MSCAPFAHSGFALIHAVVLQPFSQSVQIVSTASGLSHGPRLEAVVARRDRADRADVHQVAGEQRVDAFFLERRDLAAVAAIDDVDLRVGVDLAHEPDAARAEDAAVAVQHQRRTEVDVRLHAFAVEHAARELHPALVRARSEYEKSCSGHSPPLSQTGQSSGWLISRNSNTLARASTTSGVCGRDDHALGHRRRAGGLQLRHLLDLDDADAAGAVDAEPGVIAVVGDLDAALDRRLENGLALFDRDLPAVDRQRDGVHKIQSYNFKDSGFRFAVQVGSESRVQGLTVQEFRDVGIRGSGFRSRFRLQPTACRFEDDEVPRTSEPDYTWNRIPNLRITPITREPEPDPITRRTPEPGTLTIERHLTISTSAPLSALAEIDRTGASQRDGALRDLVGERDDDLFGGAGLVCRS